MVAVLFSCVTTSKLLALSELQFLQKENKNGQDLAHNADTL